MYNITDEEYKNFDTSEIIFQELGRAIINIYKVCVEEMGYDMNATKNYIDYHNFLIDNPVYLYDPNAKTEDDDNYGDFTDDLNGLSKAPINSTLDGSHQGKFDNKRDFVITLYNEYLKNGISPTIAAIMVAQNANESGYGTSRIAQWNNFGGVTYAPKSADYKVPGTTSNTHAKNGWAAYNNLASFVKHKIGFLNRIYPGATTAASYQEYFKILQGGNPSGYYYCAGSPADKAQYGPKIINGFLPSVLKLLKSKA